MSISVSHPISPSTYSAHMVRGASTTFNAAIPYAVCTLTVGAIGAVIAFNAITTAMAAIGVAMALIGSFAFLGVVGCGITHAGNPEGFEKHVMQSMITGAAAAISEIITTVAKAVLLDLISGRKR